MPSKNAPSRKKSKGYYAKVKKGSGTGSKAGGGMTAKGVKKYRKDNPGSKLKTAVTTPPSKLKKIRAILESARKSEEKQCIIGKVTYEGVTSGVTIAPTRIMPALYERAA